MLGTRRLQPEDFPEWRFTFGYGSTLALEEPIGPVGIREIPLCTIKAEREGYKTCLASYASPESAWQRVLAYILAEERART